jgi:hypothetical protein
MNCALSYRVDGRKIQPLKAARETFVSAAAKIRRRIVSANNGRACNAEKPQDLWANLAYKK